MSSAEREPVPSGRAERDGGYLAVELIDGHHAAR